VGVEVAQRGNNSTELSQPVGKGLKPDEFLKKDEFQKQLGDARLLRELYDLVPDFGNNRFDY
jgi:hypothetical protein